MLPFLNVLSAVIGSGAFFIARVSKNKLRKQRGKPVIKIIFLNANDFLFLSYRYDILWTELLVPSLLLCLSPLILLGNGLGAFIVSRLIEKSMHVIQQYKYLKNGEMDSVGLLGLRMIANGFSLQIPEWISPVLAIGIISYFFLRLHRESFV